MSSFIDATSVELLRRALDSAGLIAITTHKDPDGDAVGSSLGLAHVLIALGYPTQVILPNAPPQFLQWMTGFEDAIIHDRDRSRAEAILKKASIVFCLDFNQIDRVKSLSGPLAEHPFKVMVDHHIDPDDFAKITFSDPNSCSTCQMVYDLIMALGAGEKITKAAAECFYTGIMTDTGSFRYPSTTAHTHRVAAELIERGVEQAAIHEAVLDSNTEDRLRLWGYALSQKLELYQNGQAALLPISKAELERYHYHPGDTEGLVNQGLSIQGVRLSIFLAEKGEGVKLSARSQGHLPVNQLMKEHFNGGGHMNAAGGSSPASLDATLKRFKEVIPAFLAAFPE